MPLPPGHSPRPGHAGARSSRTTAPSEARGPAGRDRGGQSGAGAPRSARPHAERVGEALTAVTVKGAAGLQGCGVPSASERRVTGLGRARRETGDGEWMEKQVSATAGRLAGKRVRAALRWDRRTKSRTRRDHGKGGATGVNPSESVTPGLAGVYLTCSQNQGTGHTNPFAISVLSVS